MANKISIKPFMSDEKKYKTFTMPEGIKALAYDCISMRAVRRSERPENFSEYIRNLIFEDYERNKGYIQEVMNKASE